LIKKRAADFILGLFSKMPTLGRGVLALKDKKILVSARSL